MLDARIEIDEIDKQMAQLFEKRMDSVKKVIAYKLQNNLPILDSQREQAVIEKNTAYVTNCEYVDYYKEFIQNLMQLSKQYQNYLSNERVIGFQGTDGAYSHIALNKIFKNVKTKSFVTFDEVFSAVEEGSVALGVLPFENSYTGEVLEVLDLLYKHNCSIIEIYDLKIQSNLLGVRGATIADIKQVYSHHQALSQSKKFLDCYNFELIPYYNTALAAKYVSECNDKTKAAVASPETAKLYNLSVLAENINTSAENTTRFIVISKSLEGVKGNRFNIIFTLDHAVGQLAKIMQIIGNFGFNMESIKSKSMHSLPWQYYFYVEIVGDVGSDVAKQLLIELKQNCREVKLIGVYSK